MLNTQASSLEVLAGRVACLYVGHPTILPNGKPYDIHERLLLFACEVIGAARFLHHQGGIARALSYQVLGAGTSIGANAAEGDGASSPSDVIAKNRIALKEAKKTRFRLLVVIRH